MAMTTVEIQILSVRLSIKRVQQIDSTSLYNQNSSLTLRLTPRPSKHVQNSYGQVQ